MLANAMADMVKRVRRGFRQIFRQAIFMSMGTIPYLFGFLKLDSVNMRDGK